MVRAARRYRPRSLGAGGLRADRGRELDVIAALKFPGCFLVVFDITQFCRRNDILCQGKGIGGKLRGLLCAGVTAVGPIANELLFEAGSSRPRQGRTARHRHRHQIGSAREAIQYVYDKYGRDYAAQSRQRHITLSGPQRSARHGPGAGVLPGSAGCLEQTDQPLERAGRFPDIEDIPRTGDRPGDADQESAAARESTPAAL